MSDVTKEQAAAFLTLARAVDELTAASDLPNEMRIGAMISAALEAGDRHFGRGSGAALLIDFVVKLIEREPTLVRQMTQQLCELNQLVLAEQRRMLSAHLN